MSSTAAGSASFAFSTAGGAALPDAALNPLFVATVDAAEEAVLNALWHAETVTGRDGRVVEALSRDATIELLAAHRRLER